MFDESHNVLLDLKDGDNLGSLDLSYSTNLDFKKSRSTFIRIKWPTSDSYVCYKLEKVQQDLIYYGSYDKEEEPYTYTWVSTDEKFIHQYNRFNSKNNTVITVECGNKSRSIEIVTNYFGTKRFTVRAPQQEGVNSAASGIQNNN